MPVLAPGRTAAHEQAVARSDAAQLDAALPQLN